MGAEGIEIGGRQYDVLFSDARQAESRLVFDSFDDSWAASDALDRLVFQGIYDTSPRRTNGCSNPISCAIVTAFDVGAVSVTGTAFTNTATQYLDLIAPYIGLGNSANSALITYANWSLRLPEEQQQAVPEPSSLLLAGAGLAALLARRRHRSRAVA
nr:PEP-CTERM sorting domain-containing protein [Pseudoduganella umbonata]